MNRTKVKLLIQSMFYTQPSKSGCILPSQQVLIWDGLISDAQLEWLEATVVGRAALDHGCGSTDDGIALMLPNFLSVLIFSLGSCLCQQLTVPVTKLVRREFCLLSPCPSVGHMQRHWAYRC